MSGVGIVTISGDTNFGNRLQNLALQETLASLGIDRVESIEGLPTGEGKCLKAHRLMSTAFQRRHQHLNRLLRRRGAKNSSEDVYTCPPERREAIREFTRQRIRTTQLGEESGRARTGIAGRYDHFVVGSDQVWNPAFTHANKEWFLDFARPEQRIAYAASFGIPEIPSYLTGRYRKGLRGLRAISVREHQAAEIVATLTGVTPPVVLDPTMLLRSEQWSQLVQVPERLTNHRYVATFMLASGDGAGSSQANTDPVHQFAKGRGLPVIDLHDPALPELRGLDPLGFAGAISGAELVVTDSFHAAVFSTLFHRPFLLVTRGSMNSRFETLLRHTGIDSRMLADVRDIGQVPDVDWDRVDAKLERQRAESMGFLQEALSPPA